MEMREFTSGHGTRLADVVRQPPRRDVRWVMSSLLVVAVVADIVVLAIRRWSILVHNSYSPLPVVLLAALAVYLLWFWRKTAVDRAALASYSERHSEDPEALQAVDRAVNALYRGLFLACMFPFLALMLLQLILTG
jgi:hypothetical protein